MARALVVATSTLVVLGGTGCGRLGFDEIIDRSTDALVPPIDAALAPDAGPPACVLPGGDEDADGISNPCDNCPTIANPTQRNQGEVDVAQLADGLGDACDPRPSESGDRIAFFDGFVVEVTDRYVPYGLVDWSTPGVVRLGALGKMAYGQLQFDCDPDFTRIEVGTTMIENAAGAGWIAVWTHFAGFDNGFAATLAGAVNSTYLNPHESVATVDRYGPAVTLGAPFAVDRRYRVLVDSTRATGADAAFTVDDELDDLSASTTFDITTPTFGAGLLEAAQQRVDFRYLIVYARD